MAKQSGLMLKIQQANEIALRKSIAVALQLAEDAAIATLGKEYGFGEKRAAAFRGAYRAIRDEYYKLLQEDNRDDKRLSYSKGVIDRDLQYILGNNFEPWEVRYPK